MKNNLDKTIQKAINHIKNVSIELWKNITNENNVAYEKGIEVDDFHYKLGKETKEIINKEKKYEKEFKKSIEKIKNNLHPGTTYNDFKIEIDKDSAGKQIILSQHKNEIVDKGFIGIFLGNYNLLKDQILKLPKEDLNPKEISNLFYNFVRENLKLAIPSSEKIKYVSNKHGLSSNKLEDAIFDLLNEDKTIQKRIKETNLNTIDKEQFAKESRILIIKRVTDGVKDLKIRKVQQTKYEVVEIDPCDYKILNEEKDLQKLVKKLCRTQELTDEKRQIVNLISSYYEQNKDKKIFVLMGCPDKKTEKFAKRIKENVEKIIKKTEEGIVLKQIVEIPKRDLIYKTESKENNLFYKIKKAAIYGSFGLFCLATLFGVGYKLGEINYSKKTNLIPKDKIEYKVEIKDGIGENIGKKEIYINGKYLTSILPTIIKERETQAIKEKIIKEFPNIGEIVKSIYIIGTNEKGEKYRCDVFKEGRAGDKDGLTYWTPDTKEDSVVMEYLDKNGKIKKIILFYVVRP